MKTPTLLGMLLLLAVAARATVVTTWDSGLLNGGNGIAIPDANPAGLILTHTFSGLDSSFNPIAGSVQVRLNISGGYNGDLYGFLVLNNGPSNEVTTVLLSRIGTDGTHPYGSSGLGFDVTLSDSGTTNIHVAPGVATGIWKPDGASLDGAFYGMSAKGMWTLFLADVSGGDTSKLMSWGLDVTVNSMGPVAGLRWTTSPGGATSGSPFTTQPVLKTVDQYGNPTTNGLPANLIVTVSKTAGAGTLFGTTTYDIGAGAGNGVVTGSGLGVTGSGSVDLTATVPVGYGTPVAGMAVWLDGNDASTLTGSSPVTAWNDKSGNAKHFSTTIGPSGSISAGATINGHGAVSFPSTGRGLLNSTYTNSGPDTTIFVVQRHASGSWGSAEGAVSSSSGGSDSGSPTSWALTSLSGSSAALWRNNVALPNGTALPAANGTTAGIWMGAFDNTGDRYLVGVVSLGQTNEVDGTPSLSGNFAINQLLVGGRLSAPSTGGNWCNGDIGEVLIYNTFLDDSNRDAVKTYLAAKWLDTNAPAYPTISNATTTVVLAAPAAYTISGSVALQSFLGNNRLVRFILSNSNGPIYLQTNDVTLTNFSGGSASYTLTVPTNTTHISAKTAWNLRKRQAANFTAGAATVNFTGTNTLKGGDIITVPVPPGTIDDTDNAVTSPDYLLLLGNYLQTVNGSPAIGRADIDGDGAITSSDYLNLLGNYLTSGDPQ